MKAAPGLPFDEWPEIYQRAFRRLEVPRRGRRKYAAATLAATRSGMGQYLATVRRAGLPPELSHNGLAAFIEDLDSRALSNATRLHYLATVQAVAKEAGYPSAERAILLEDCAIYRGDMRLDTPRKVRSLQQRPLTLADLRRASANAWRASQIAGAPNRRRSLMQRAVLLKLLSFVPLRIGDVSRLVIGSSLLRESDGWRLRMSSGKTGYRYDTFLHEDLSNLLDAFVCEEAGNGDLLAACRRQDGQPLFGNDLGEPLSAQTLRLSFKAATGHTPHVVRTLVHDELASLGAQGTALAMDLCGQVSEGIEKHYQVYARRHRQQEAQKALALLQRPALAQPGFRDKVC